MPLHPDSSKSAGHVNVKITILEGEGLAVKDRNLLGKKTSSDPFVALNLRTSKELRKIGKTKTKQKTICPKWNESFQFNILGDELSKSTFPFAQLELVIYDEDVMSENDLMGKVTLNIPAKSTTGAPEWHDVPPESAKNATGRLKVQVDTEYFEPRSLIRGNSFPLQANRICVGLAWDMIRSREEVDLDVSCVAVKIDGSISMQDTVYYGNLSNPGMSIVHSGDEREGDEQGDDERIRFQLDRIPPFVLALYMILTVATPPMRIPDIKSTSVRLINEEEYSKPVLCMFSPAQHALSRNSTAMFLVRIARAEVSSNTWVVSPIEDTHPTARDFGSLIPQIKSYTKDLVPSINIDPTERVAIMRKGGTIRLTDYCPSGTLPETVTLGLAWDITNGVNIDLDASAVCLDSDLSLIDQVWFRQLRSKDGSIQHGGDEREGDEIGDDEKISIHLSKVNPAIQYIGFVVNSYSGQELDDVERASCHLFDQVTNVDMASYALTNSSALNGYSALVMGCLYRGRNPGEWGLCIISEAAQGKTVQDNVDELQNYLRRSPPQIPQEEEEEIDLSQMPEAVPLEDVEIDLSK